MYQRNDLVAVSVSEPDELPRAIGLFVRKWKHSGIKAELEFRANHPSRSSRRKAKQLKVRRRWCKWKA